MKFFLFPAASSINRIITFALHRLRLNLLFPLDLYSRGIMLPFENLQRIKWQRICKHRNDHKNSFYDNASQAKTVRQAPTLKNIMIRKQTQKASEERNEIETVFFESLRNSRINIAKLKGTVLNRSSLKFCIHRSYLRST